MMLTSYTLHMHIGSPSSEFMGACAGNLQLDSAGNVYFINEMNAPIFYTEDDALYYVSVSGNDLDGDKVMDTCMLPAFGSTNLFPF